jgi:glycosyltransferase involved in cell wall biosynthesis
MKKKICFVVSDPGTAVVFLKDHIDRLSELFEVYLVANIKNESEIKDLKLTGFKNIQIERKPRLKADMKALWQLYKYLRQERFYVAQSMASKPSLLMSIAAFFARVPNRIRFFSGQIWCNMTGLKRRFFKGIDKLTVVLNTELISDGYPQMNYLIEQKIVKHNQIKVLGNGSICGVDISRFNPVEKVRNKVRNELNYSEENIVYVFLGRLKKDKGIYELLSAFDKLIVGSPQARLLLIGTDEENCYRWLDNFPNISDGEMVRFYGFTNQPNIILQAGDVHILPSYREAFGMAVLEASSLRLPVICSDIYGMADTFVEGVTGLKCKVKDEISLCECMRQLYGDKDLRLSMGTAGRERVKNDFSKQLVTDAWVEYYKSFV